MSSRQDEQLMIKDCSGHERRASRYRLGLKIVFLAIPLVVLSGFGILHIVLVIKGHVSFNKASTASKPSVLAWATHVRDSEQMPTVLRDVTVDVTPIPCHSHNDYWRTVPLFEALRAGCSSVEADIWLPQDDTANLLVGHNKRSLSSHRTLNEMYLSPILDLLALSNANKSCSESSCNGVFRSSPRQTLVLLLDFKDDGTALYPFVDNSIADLRQQDYLSYSDNNTFVARPVTVVATGNAPYAIIANETQHRDIFYDAPIASLSGATPAYTNSTAYYASTSFKKSIGTLWNGRITHAQRSILEEQISRAKKLGLKARYWDTPSWPTSLRNHVWQVLIDEGADVLNVDDLAAAAFADWSMAQHKLADA